MKTAARPVAPVPRAAEPDSELPPEGRSKEIFEQFRASIEDEF